jgi:hypothetical protein
VATYADVIELLLAAGRAEDAMDVLAFSDDSAVMTTLQDPAFREEYFKVRIGIAQRLRAQLSDYDSNPAQHFRLLKHLTALIVGDYAKVESVLEQALKFAQLEFVGFRKDVLRPLAPKGDNLTDEELHQWMVTPSMDGESLHHTLGARASHSALEGQWHRGTLDVPFVAGNSFCWLFPTLARVG